MSSGPNSEFARQLASPAAIYLQLMANAAAHAVRCGGTQVPMLAPEASSILRGEVPLSHLQAQGVRVVPWTVNHPGEMRELIRIGVDGIISDRPDLLRGVLSLERSSSAAAAESVPFECSGHRGARGLRPENTLPAFEAALDDLVDTIETDIGITADRRPLLWHDQYLDSSRRRTQGGSPVRLDDRVYIRDVSLDMVQRSFICDQIGFGPTQVNDVTLSPVSVAFAQQEGLLSPYVPIEMGQLFRFTSFYAKYYASGMGKHAIDASQRAGAAEKVGFNLEAKILPDNSATTTGGMTDLTTPELSENRTVPVEDFVRSLCGAIETGNMTQRARVLSFDFRVLLIVQERYTEIRTCYLTEDPNSLTTDSVPELLRPVWPTR